MNYRGRDQFAKYKKLINLMVFLFTALFAYRLRLFFFNHIRMLPGIVGLGLRYALLKTLARNTGDNVSVHPNVYLFNLGQLDIGENVSIHPMCYIDAQGTIKIGNDVSIAHGVTILSGNHIYADLTVPIKDQGVCLRATEVDNNVWIGAKATILAGVQIASGSIIAAGAVVNKSTEPDSIVGGIPAALIKYRGD